MGFVDDKGRPELVVNPAIKLGMAFFRPVETPGEPGDVERAGGRGRRSRKQNPVVPVVSAPAARKPGGSVRAESSTRARGAGTRASVSAPRRRGAAASKPDTAARTTSSEQEAGGASPRSNTARGASSTASGGTEKRKAGGHPLG